MVSAIFCSLFSSILVVLSYSICSFVLFVALSFPQVCGSSMFFFCETLSYGCVSSVVAIGHRHNRLKLKEPPNSNGSSSSSHHFSHHLTAILDGKSVWFSSHFPKHCRLEEMGIPESASRGTGNARNMGPCLMLVKWCPSIPPQGKVQP